MGKVYEHFLAKRQAPAPAPWLSHTDAAADLEAISDLLVSTPMVRALLGPNVNVAVRVSASGRGLVFELEPQA